MNKLPLIVFLVLVVLAATVEHDLRRILWPFVILCGIALIVYVIVSTFA